MKTPAFLQTLLTDYLRWAAWGVAVSVMAAGYFLILDTRIEGLRTSGLLEREKVEADLAERRQYLQDLRESVAKFQASMSAEELAGVDAFIPTGPDFPGLLLTLEAIANDSNLQLDSMNTSEIGQIGTPSGSSATAEPGTAQAATPESLSLRTQDVNVSVSGGESYESFKRFITQIESSQRLLDVVSVNFSNRIETEGENQASGPYNLVIRTYYLPN